MQVGRWRSRVRGLPEALGELPVAGLAEEIDTPGEGQVRALFTLAGNPVVSTPNAGPPAPGARGPRPDGERRHLRERDHSPRRRDPAGAVAAVSLPLRPRALPARRAQRRELLAGGARARRLADARVAHAPAAGRHRRRPGPRRRPRRLRRPRDRQLVARELQDPASPLAGPRRRGADRGARAAPRPRARARLDAALRARTATASAPTRTGSRSRSSRRRRTASTSARWSRASPRCCAPQSGKIELAPEPIVADLDRLRASLARHRNGGIVLIGRRQLRSNNSWMHNVPNLVRGKERCTMHVHPDDAAAARPRGRRPRERDVRARARSRCRSR